MRVMLRSLYLAVRAWVDRGVAGSSGDTNNVLLAPILLPVAVAALLFGGDTLSERLIRLSPVLLWSMLWFGFSGWRYYLGLRRQSVRNDRHFDIWGKHKLPPEYADSESATKAKRRRK